MTENQQNPPPNQAPNNSSNPSRPGRAGSPPVVGSAPPIASTPAQQPVRSYAHATKNSVSGPAVQALSSNSSGAQHGHSPSVNGPADMASPAIVNSSAMANGASATSNHGRKPSRTISANGASGQIPNGGPATPTSRPNINFGSINAGDGSPAIANSTPNHQPTTSLPVQKADPRITSPGFSPSPIPQPQSSGGRPPSGLQGQANALNFGSLGGNEGDGNRQFSGPPQQHMMPNQNTHYRRASSQSQQGDMPNPGMSMGPGGGRYMSGSGRGRGYGGPYPQMPYSPGPGYRPMPGQQRPGPPFPPHFQNHMMGPGSPHPPPRSPAPMHGSQSSTPQMQHMQMAPGQPMGYPQFPNYMNQLGQAQNPYTMQGAYDPNFQYYQQPYPGHPGYMPPGPPQSPRAIRQMPPTAQQQHMQAQFNQTPSQNMSRTSSQVSERPASSMGSAPQPPPQLSGTPSGGHPSHSHSQSTSAAAAAAAPAANFTIPRREKKGIEIKNAAGEVVTFDKKPSPSPSVAKSPPPAEAMSSSNATPPPRSSSTSSHARSDSKAGKSAAEIKAEFQEQVKKEQERDKPIQEDDVISTAKPVPSDSGKDDSSIRSVSETQQTTSKPDPEAAKAEPVKEAAGVEKTETDEERKKREQDEETERMIAEMEAADREEEEKERAYNEKKQKEADAKAALEKEEASKADERMKKAEREAEALEEARESEKPEQEETAEAKAEREQLFASLKKPSVGPGAESPSGAETPTTNVSEDSQPLPKPSKSSAGKPKPLPLKLETAKPVEAPQQTPGMRSLKSARMLQLQTEAVTYPEGIQSPNPALNQSTKRGGRMYDNSFLLQFREAFREKPDVDWDKRLKETLGDTPDSAQPKSARTPSGMGSRAASNRGPPPSAFNQTAMGNFHSGQRTIPAGTTSAERFNASTHQSRTMQNPLAGYANRQGGTFPMPPANMVRQPSLGGMPPQHGTRAVTNRGGSRGGSTRGESQRSKKELDKDNHKMPLTAGSNLKPLEASGSGWKPPSVGRTMSGAVTDPSGYLAPDMVQRKVKSNLNKMTPERFEKITDQILAITAQSKDETDGRTLRQVIALTFEKACDEAHWASMYAKFCKRMLEEMTPEIKDENVKDRSGNPVVGGALFRKYLLNRCQEEFERGWEVNLPMKEEGSGETAMLSDEYYIAAAAKRKGLGLIQFIGELYKLGMLSIRIMHQCVHRLLDFEGMPDESTVESLTKLLRTVGAQMDMTEQGHPYVNSYFERIDLIMKKEGLPSRMHFMIMDLVDLRRQGWKSKNDAKGPKTIQEIREEAAAAQQAAELERQRQHQRGGNRISTGGRDSRNFSGNQAPPDYAKNTVSTNELKQLSQKAGSSAARQSSGGAGRMGPPSMLGPRTNSGRTLGPPSSLMSRASPGGGDSSPSSGMHSRSSSLKPGDKKDDDVKSSLNSFGALADMRTEDAEKTPGSSPRVSKANPAAGQAAAPSSSAEQSKSAGADEKGGSS